MVSALDSGSSGPCKSQAEVIVLCSWARRIAVPLSTQEYKWVPANLLLGVAMRGTSTPSRGGGGGGRYAPSRFMPQKRG